MQKKICYHDMWVGRHVSFPPRQSDKSLTLLGLGLIKINDVFVSANFNNPRPSLILNN